MQLQIASRVLSVLLISLVLGALAYTMESHERQTVESFSTYEDLLAYEKSYEMGSYWMCALVVLLAGSAYIALVEGFAFLIRVGTSRLSHANSN